MWDCSDDRRVNYHYIGGGDIMGSLDQPTGSNVARKIKLIDTTGYTISQLETAYNDTYGVKGWRFIQIVQIGSKNYVLAEKEL